MAYRGAFLLAADGGLEGGGGSRGDEEPQLPTDGPTCLQKVFTVCVQASNLVSEMPQDSGT